MRLRWIKRPDRVLPGAIHEGLDPGQIQDVWFRQNNMPGDFAASLGVNLATSVASWSSGEIAFNGQPPLGETTGEPERHNNPGHR
jgi:hypothetical protein